MEKPVHGDLEAKVGSKRIVQTGEQVMPLQYLVQHDPVKETAEREAYQQPAVARPAVDRD
jgi:hypothetical protein